MSAPLAIIGDIHGDAPRLRALLPELDGRDLIFLGDFVNRGSSSRETIDLLCAVRCRDPRAVFLAGNHEFALLDFIRGAIPFREFAALGGIPTIKDYLPRAVDDVRREFRDAFPDDHVQFLKACGLFWETEEMIVSHCGINPNAPNSRDAFDMVLSRHERLFSSDFRPPKLVVCGHYCQPSGAPLIGERVICLDTGCGTYGGPLTALLLPERTYLQR